MPGRSLVAGFALFLAACGGTGDIGASRLKGIEEGMSREQVLDVMGSGPLSAQFSDTMRVERGFRRSEYLVNGTTLTVLFYRETPGDVSESVDRATETPIVLQNGKAIGWGWRFYDEQRAELKLPDLTTPVAPEANPILPTPDSATM